MSSNHLGLEEDLQKLCDKENVSFELFQKLLEIERDSQNKEKRFGIFEKIKNEIEKEVDRQKNVIE